MYVSYSMITEVCRWTCRKWLLFRLSPAQSYSSFPNLRRLKDRSVRERGWPLMPVLFLPTMLILVSLPLALNLLSRNSYFGIRTSRTLASAEAWAAANTAAGVAGVVGGILAVAVNAAIMMRWNVPIRQKSLACVAVGIASMMISIGVGLSSAPAIR